MNILIINYHFPPSSTAHSYRWAQIAQQFRLAGHSVSVIAGGSSGDEDDVLSVTRTNFILRSDNKNARVTILSSTPSFWASIKCKAQMVIKYVYRRVFWPDGLWHWLPMAVFEVFRRRKLKYDVVIGYSPTFASALAARFYKCLNSEARLIIDFGDPFSLSETMPVNNTSIYKRLNYAAERFVFKAANKVSMTNAETVSAYRAAHPAMSNIVCIPHLVDVDAFYTPAKKPTKIITAGYIGAFHQNIREPDSALAVLNQLQELIPSIQAHFYGPLNGVEFNCYGRVQYLGVIPRDEAILRLQEFNIVINIENEKCAMSPSKINECIASGKPILNFLSGTGISSFIGHPLVFDVSHTTDVVDVVAFVKSTIGKCLSRSDVDTFLKGKTLSSVAASYLEEMN